MKDFDITDYNYIGSSIGNAYFSNVQFGQLWSCVAMAESREQLDSAITATIKLNDIVSGGKHE